jgi:hypothetical protein
MAVPNRGAAAPAAAEVQAAPLWKRLITPDPALNYTFLASVYAALAALSALLYALQHFEVAEAITGFWLVVRTLATFQRGTWPRVAAGPFAFPAPMPSRCCSSHRAQPTDVPMRLAACTHASCTVVRAAAAIARA